MLSPYWEALLITFYKYSILILEKKNTGEQ